jgi:hypothetical protein
MGKKFIKIETQKRIYRLFEGDIKKICYVQK